MNSKLSKDQQFRLDVNLINSIKRGNLDYIDKCLSEGARIDDQASSQYSSPIVEAAKIGAIEVIDLLLNKGADINKFCSASYQLDEDSDEETYSTNAIFEAVKAESLDLVKYLVSRGADVHVTDNSGDNLLMPAIYLEDEGSINYDQYENITDGHRLYHDNKIVRYLLEKNVSPLIEDVLGYSVLDKVRDMNPELTALFENKLLLDSSKNIVNDSIYESQDLSKRSRL